MEGEMARYFGILQSVVQTFSDVKVRSFRLRVGKDRSHDATLYYGLFHLEQAQSPQCDSGGISVSGIAVAFPNYEPYHAGVANEYS
jgi:hypothetical protein